MAKIFHSFIYLFIYFIRKGIFALQEPIYGIEFLRGNNRVVASGSQFLVLRNLRK